MRKAVDTKMNLTTEELKMILRALVLLRVHLEVIQVVMPQVFTVQFMINKIEAALEKHKGLK